MTKIVRIVKIRTLFTIKLFEFKEQKWCYFCDFTSFSTRNGLSHFNVHVPFQHCLQYHKSRLVQSAQRFRMSKLTEIPIYYYEMYFKQKMFNSILCYSIFALRGAEVRQSIFYFLRFPVDVIHQSIPHID